MSNPNRPTPEDIGRTFDPPKMGAGPIMNRNKGRLRMDIISRDGESLHCRAVRSDLPLSARINIGADRFNAFLIPDLGLRGDVSGLSRERYLVHMTLRADWLDRVDAVRTLVDKKKIGYFIRAVELRMGGEWVSTKPQRLRDSHVAVAGGDDRG